LNNAATISPLSPVSADENKSASIINLLSPEEEILVDLIANIAVDKTLKQAYEEKGDPIFAI